jgi:predicted nucleotidyltransferase
MKFGIKDTTFEEITQILTEDPCIESAIIYGSRAKGNFRNGSDIDLTLKGPNLHLQNQLDLMDRLDDSLIPYTFDISIFHQISNPDLIDHIERVGQVFYQKSDHAL